VTGGIAGIQLWDVATGGRRGDIGDEFAYASDAALSADGARVALARQQAGDGGAEVWDVASRSRLASLDSGADATELTVAFSPDGRLLATAGFGRYVRLWDVASRRLVRKLDLGAGGSSTLEFSPDGATLAVSRLNEPVATLWDVATGIRIGPTLTAGRRTAMVDVSDDGRQLLLTLANGEGAIWDIDPKSWARRACALANRTLTREEWDRFLPGRPYTPACT
jgi:WD40 repeat protein